MSAPGPLRLVEPRSFWRRLFRPVIYRLVPKLKNADSEKRHEMCRDAFRDFLPIIGDMDAHYPRRIWRHELKLQLGELPLPPSKRSRVMLGVLPPADPRQLQLPFER